MIWHPKIGQAVALHYRKEVRRHMACEGRRGAVVRIAIGHDTVGIFQISQPLHQRRGTVMRVARGPGPINVEVLLDPPEDGVRVAAAVHIRLIDREIYVPQVSREKAQALAGSLRRYCETIFVEPTAEAVAEAVRIVRKG
jgi:hypothetical protein